jgi:hypothetical protein|tara:strand:+ start:3371 stop:3583 length:213 start_codon:yes stop_codon:yes gene_type:complete
MSFYYYSFRELLSETWKNILRHVKNRKKAKKKGVVAARNSANPVMANRPKNMVNMSANPVMKDITFLLLF